MPSDAVSGAAGVAADSGAGESGVGSMPAHSARMASSGSPVFFARASADRCARGAGIPLASATLARSSSMLNAAPAATAAAATGAGAAGVAAAAAGIASSDMGGFAGSLPGPADLSLSSSRSTPAQSASTRSSVDPECSARASAEARISFGGILRVSAASRTRSSVVTATGGAASTAPGGGPSVIGSDSTASGSSVETPASPSHSRRTASTVVPVLSARAWAERSTSDAGIPLTSATCWRSWSSIPTSESGYRW